MFHKNIPNNNKDIIRFLAKNFAGTKKVRNSILFCGRAANTDYRISCCGRRRIPNLYFRMYIGRILPNGIWIRLCLNISIKPDVSAEYNIFSGMIFAYVCMKGT